MTPAILPLLRRHRWATLLLQQAAVFGLSFGFMAGVHALTGKSLHGGREAMGPLEYAGLMALFAGLVLFTRWLYHRVEGKTAPALGMALSWPAFGHLVAGTLGGFVLLGWPQLVGLDTGSLQVKATVFQQGGPLAVALLMAAGALSLTANSVMEEVCSRAFPLMLWREKSLAFRLLVPALLFAALHLAVEPFRAGAFAQRTVAGLAFSALYLLTRNVWLAAGVHTGTNEAVLFTTSRWQMGGLFATEGAAWGPEWLPLALWTLLFVGVLAVLVQRERAAVQTGGTGRETGLAPALAR
ncbi:MULTISPECIES: type II CAAX prenyl endopeptidase Rce1 family protein [Myxococcaceae]|uniref:CPBP family glutamic-type intramembrane protease n=1 Tax=Myxococcaceae TaxID=31 RepID=UPI00188FF544|nr:MULTISPECIES: CPBP family glutamic-type intramembrane protease [Myxococcaceae]MBF5041529.1 CPBP family intramembrane metalloprotease [Simulacricoccus sp. 17bor-14]